MIVFRISKAPHHLDLSGKGAELKGHRWNSIGVPMLYTSESRALCLAEVLVHIRFGIRPLDYFLVSIEIPDDSPIGKPPFSPDSWNPIIENLARPIGDNFVAEQRYLGLWVPSAVVTGDKNLLLNPRHPEFPKVRIVEVVPFDFDPRLY